MLIISVHETAQVLRMLWTDLTSQSTIITQRTQWGTNMRYCALIHRLISVNSVWILLSVHSAHGMCREVLRAMCQTQAYSAAPHWPTALSSARQEKGHDTVIINFHYTGTITLGTDIIMKNDLNIKPQ